MHIICAYYKEKEASVDKTGKSNEEKSVKKLLIFYNTKYMISLKKRTGSFVEINGKVW